MNKGRLITVEGADGSGKTTQLEYIGKKIAEKGIPLVKTREPGGTVLGERLREILLGKTDLHIGMNSELLLMFAARAQHLEQVILPALRSGSWILSDRFTDATYAYQGGGRGITTERIEILEQWVQQGLQPDLTILFDVPVQTGLDRTLLRNTEPDRFEIQKVEFKEAVRNSYLERVNCFPERIQVVDSSVSISDVRSQIDNILSAFNKKVFGNSQ